MAQKHLIMRETIEVTAPDIATARVLQETLAEAQSNRLTRVMDDVFSDLGREDEVIIFDRVVVDLELNGAGDFEEVFEREMRYQLRYVLSRRIPTSASEVQSRSEGATQGVDDRHLEAISVFLAGGTLPWWAPGDLQADIEATVHKLVEVAPDRVEALLRAMAATHTIERITKQFSSALVVELFEVASPGRGTEVYEAARRWADVTMGRSEAVGEPSLEGTAVVAEVLRHLYSRSSTVTVAPEQMNAHLLAWTANRFRRSQESTARFLAESAAATGRADELRDWLEQAAGPPGVADHGEGDGEAPGSPIAEKGERALGPATAGPAGEVPLGATPRDLASGFGGVGATAAPAAPSPLARRSDGDPLQSGQAADSVDRMLPAGDAEDTRYVGNAGLVLLWPFLAAFFDRINLVEGGRFASEGARERAVGLLHYVATGSSDCREQHLDLNKVLCGWPMTRPVQRDLVVSDAELREVRELLEAVIEHWEALGHTSVAGFRSAFLQREGRLRLAEFGWSLLVARLGRDVLLERLPWSIGHVVLPWMQEPLYVEW
jgi:hypothetical protein